MNTLLPEIWSHIFWHACVDTGRTGCSISETCRFFNDVGKPTRFRSVALQGSSRLISFWHATKSLPPHHLRIENMYIAFAEIDEETDISHLPKSFCLESVVDEMPFSTLMHVLTAAAPSLVYLYLSLGMKRETVVLPMEFPYLHELVIHGQYTDQENAEIEIIPTLVNLRRLRISNLFGYGDDAILTIPTRTPYLTHLRFDRHNGCSGIFIKALQNTLQSTQLLADTGGGSVGPVDLKYPASLKRLLIHPGVRHVPRCGTVAFRVQRAQLALDRMMESDPRIFLYDHILEETKKFPLGNLNEWLDRINGKMAYWEESNSTNDQARPISGFSNAS